EDSAPLPLAAARTPARRRPWLWGAAAAAALFALVGGPAWYVAADLSQARETVRAHQETLAQAHGQLGEFREQLARLPDERLREPEELLGVERRRGLEVCVTGAAAVQPGEAAAFLVRTRDLDGKPAPANVWAALAGRPGRRLPAQR